jgi:hypothetical protein
MYKIFEIVIVVIIILVALVIFILNLRQQLKGKCSFGNSCESCKIKDTCTIIKDNNKLKDKK